MIKHAFYIIKGQNSLKGHLKNLINIIINGLNLYIELVIQVLAFFLIYLISSVLYYP